MPTACGPARLVRYIPRCMPFSSMKRLFIAPTSREEQEGSCRHVAQGADFGSPLVKSQSPCSGVGWSFRVTLRCSNGSTPASPGLAPGPGPRRTRQPSQCPVSVPRHSLDARALVSRLTCRQRITIESGNRLQIKGPWKFPIQAALPRDIAAPPLLSRPHPSRRPLGATQPRATSLPVAVQ